MRGIMKHIDFENFELEKDKNGGFDIIGSVINKRGKKVPGIDNTKPKNKRISKLDLILNRLDTLEENDKKIFERLDRLEANDKMIFEKLEEHSKILDQHSKILDQHSKILADHSRILEEHSLKFERIVELNHLKTQEDAKE
jgi:hypothetical protein